MAVHLTDEAIKNLETRATRYEVSDTDAPGLRLRVYESGARVFSFWYRARDGRTSRIRIGAYPGTTLAKARKAARAHRVSVEGGGDPQGILRKARATVKARKDAKRVSDLCDDFTAERDKAVKRDSTKRKGWRPSTRAGWVRYMKADIKPLLGKRLVSELTADDVLRFVAVMRERRKPVSVARCYEVLRKLLKWATARRTEYGLIVSPCVGLDVAEMFKDNRAAVREVTFDDDALRAILGAVAKTELRVLLPLLFETAARQGEARAAKWSDIDLDAKTWTLPASVTKNAIVHTIPLTTRAVELLETIRPEDGKGFVFPAETREGYMDPPRDAVRTIRETSGVKTFRLHDVRRTVRTRLAGLGVDERVAESVLGHLPPKLVRTYSPKWADVERMRAALDRWSAELARILAAKPADVLAFEVSR
jgi:integrase